MFFSISKKPVLCRDNFLLQKAQEHGTLPNKGLTIIKGVF